MFTLKKTILTLCPTKIVHKQTRRMKKTITNLSSLFTPLPVKPNPEEDGVGKELTGNIPKTELIKVLNRFYQMPQIKQLASDNGLDGYLQHQAYLSFRRFCVESESLPVDLHVTISDIIRNATHVSDVFPYYLRHARQMFPHLDCMDDLKRISDLTFPPSWYQNARSMQRKFIIHAGPTNSGKTYHALERFINAKSGVYCGPLKLLATEVYKKSNERGTPCDLVTGEERKFALENDTPSNHVSCTVEMTNVNVPYEVAVIDEIQLLKDPQRGWAWTRALLGVMANEIHLCGEEASIDLISALALTCNENVEICRYKRLTELTIEDKALVSLHNVEPGDCIVCFSKNDIYTVSRMLESQGKEIAVIYGGLPPGTKLAQAQKFNDPNHSCKILIATDAIGMGLNLSIRRVIFYSLIKPVMNEKGEKELDVISISQALQIAGRAGRYGTKFEKGFVTTFRAEDLPILQNLLGQMPETITKAGLHPTAEQIEMYAYHLPNSTLSNLMSIFEGICTVDDSLYFMCNTEDFKFLAEMIQHVPLPLRSRYLFCCAPINRKMPFVCSLFLKFARQFSKNEAVTYTWLCKNISTPFNIPKSISDLVHLEAVFDVLDLYLWLSIRFTDLFPAVHQVRQLQIELDAIIQKGVTQITRLLEASENIQKEDEIEDETPKYIKYGKGKLTDKLMSEGLLTPGMLNQLRKEWKEGFVTTFRAEDSPILQNLLGQMPETITKAGLHPTAEQIEMYVYHLPNSTLLNLMSIFEGICTVDDSLYFMCNTEDFKFLAEMIQHVPLPLRSRYLFCCAPINRKMPFVCLLFLKFARQFSKNEAVTYTWLCKNISTPFNIPKSISDLVHLEAVFDVLDLYLWLSIRFPDLFPAVHQVRQLQIELDAIIQKGVTQITRLLEASENIQKEDEIEDETPKYIKYGKEKLTDKLMSEGLLTPGMLNQLRKEWKEISRSESHLPDTKSRRKRKPKN